MCKLKLFYLIVAIVLASCKSDFVSFEETPKNFIASYKEISDDVLSGFKYPDVINIYKDRFVYIRGHIIDMDSIGDAKLDSIYDVADSLNKEFDLLYSSFINKDLPIIKVNQRKSILNSIVLFCGKPNEDYGAERRYQLTFTDGLLIVEEVVPNSEEDEIKFIGKFNKVNEHISQ